MKSKPPKHGTESPSPLVGEGGERHRREPGEGATRSSDVSPSPALTAFGHPLPPSGRSRPSSTGYGEREEGQRERQICVARIGAPHGVRGAMKLWPFTYDPLAIENYGALSAKDGTRTFEIVSLRAAKDHLVATFNGIDDRDAAARLNGVELYVSRAALPPAEDGEYYHADLIGLAAVDLAGAALGCVIAMHNFGAGDIIEIAPRSGPSMLLPFTDAVVPIIDLTAGHAVVVLPQEIDGDTHD